MKAATLSKKERESKETDECTFRPNISPFRGVIRTSEEPKGFVENIARMREAFNRKEESKRRYRDLGNYAQESLALERAQRIDGKLVPEPFLFKHSAAFTES